MELDSLQRQGDAHQSTGDNDVNMIEGERPLLASNSNLEPQGTFKDYRPAESKDIKLPGEFHAVLNEFETVIRMCTNMALDTERVSNPHEKDQQVKAIFAACGLESLNFEKDIDPDFDAPDRNPSKQFDNNNDFELAEQEHCPSKTEDIGMEQLDLNHNADVGGHIHTEAIEKSKNTSAEVKTPVQVKTTDEKTKRTRQAKEGIEKYAAMA